MPNHRLRRLLDFTYDSTNCMRQSGIPCQQQLLVKVVGGSKHGDHVHPQRLRLIVLPARLSNSKRTGEFAEGGVPAKIVNVVHSFAAILKGTRDVDAVRWAFRINTAI